MVEFDDDVLPEEEGADAGPAPEQAENSSMAANNVQIIEYAIFIVLLRQLNQFHQTQLMQL